MWQMGSGGRWAHFRALTRLNAAGKASSAYDDISWISHLNLGIRSWFNFEEAYRYDTSTIDVNIGQ